MAKRAAATSPGASPAREEGVEEGSREPPPPIPRGLATGCSSRRWRRLLEDDSDVENEEKDEVDEVVAASVW